MSRVLFYRAHPDIFSEVAQEVEIRRNINVIFFFYSGINIFSRSSQYTTIPQCSIFQTVGRDPLGDHGGFSGGSGNFPEITKTIDNKQTQITSNRKKKIYYVCLTVLSPPSSTE